MAHVGEQVRLLREEKGWTQPRLSVETGLAVSGISQIENGRRNPNSATLAKLAAALGVEVADLFPKVEAPLPFEEGQRRSPFLEAWIAYIRQRAEVWEENLERLKDSGTEKPFQIEEWSELAQTEATSLFSAIHYAMEPSGLFDLTDEQELGLESACMKLVRVTDRWRELSESAWAAVYDKGRKLLAEEKATRAAQESQKVVALFEERRSA